MKRDTRRRSGDQLLPMVQSYFVDYLQGVVGASFQTVRSYRDSIRLFFVFLAQQNKRPVSGLKLADITETSVLAFLDYVEKVRQCSAATRNYRLAALRSFADYLLRRDIAHAGQYSAIISIRTKKATQREIAYLEPDEARAVIEQVRDDDSSGARDRALLLFLYNTGARVSEALAVRPCDLRLDRPRRVRLLGKGNKERTCILWPETVTSLRRIINGREATNEAIFRSARGDVLTRDGVAYVITKHVERAMRTKPALRGRRVTPHVLRHSCAVALLQAGVPLTVIRDFLGHSSIESTIRYLKVNLKMKRKAMTAFWKKSGLRSETTRSWKPSPALLQFLQGVAPPKNTPLSGFATGEMGESAVIRRSPNRDSR